MSDDNSSDVSEDETRPRKAAKYSHLSRRTIESIIASATSDRRQSKKRYKSLEFGRGAPETQASQYRWKMRLDTFREHTLKQDLKIAPDGETIERFFDSIVAHIKPGGDGRPVPSERYLINALSDLVEYGRFEYKDFRLTPHDSTRLKTLFDGMVREGRIIRGRWKKRQWIGFLLTVKLTNAYYETAFTYGVNNFDHIVSRVLSMTLMAVAGNRSGDIGKNPFYSEEYCLHYSDIDLVLKDGTSYEHLEAEFDIKHGKDNKDTRNQSFRFYCHPLDNPKFNCACPIANLLAHALRHGLVMGTTVEQVLHHAAQRGDGKVQWLRPELPVIPGIASNHRELDLETPAGSQQLQQTVKRAGLVAGVLIPLTSHMFRYGHAKEAAQLEKFAGAATGAVAQSMNHSRRAFNSGVTENYVGGITQKIYNDRAELQYNTPYAPKVSDAFRIQRLTHEEVLQECNARGVDSTIKAERLKASLSIHKRKQEAWMKEELESPRARIQTSDKLTALDLEKYNPRTPLRQMTSNEINKTYVFHAVAPVTPSPKAANALIAAPAEVEEDLAFADDLLDTDDMYDIDLGHDEDDDCLLDDPIVMQDIDDLDLGDPQIYAPGQPDPVDLDAYIEKQDLLDGLGTETSASELQRIERMLAGVDTYPTVSSSDGVDDLTPQEEQWAFDIDQQATSTTSSVAFVNALARYNVVRHGEVALHWTKNHEKALALTVSGNARDAPTPFLYPCKVAGCPYRHHLKAATRKHGIICKYSAASPPTTTAREHACPHPGCKRRFKEARLADKHFKYEHESWIPKACDAGCRPSFLFSTRGGYDIHMARKHDSTWAPKPCPIAAQCQAGDKLFRNADALRTHLMQVHQLTADERAKYVPKKPSGRKVGFRPSKKAKTDTNTKKQTEH